MQLVTVNAILNTLQKKKSPYSVFISDVPTYEAPATVPATKVHLFLLH